MPEYYSISDGDNAALETLCTMVPYDTEKGFEILEIGCGRSSGTLNKYGKLTIVDIDAGRMSRYPYATHIKVDSMKFKTDKKYDLIFIDGVHTYSYIKNDLDNLYPRVKSGGILCGHDYEGLPFDEQFINQDCVGEKHHGVVKAVSEKFKYLITFPGSCIWGVKCP